MDVNGCQQHMLKPMLCPQDDYLQSKDREYDDEYRQYIEKDAVPGTAARLSRWMSCGRYYFIPSRVSERAEVFHGVKITGYSAYTLLQLQHYTSKLYYRIKPPGIRQGELIW